jgi:hypothetical protein
MIHRLIDVFMDAMRDMGVDCRCPEVERLAVMIHRVMSYQSRQFHTLEHVFGFLEGSDPVSSAGADAETAIAAAFHDLVYYQVDDGLPPELESILGPYLVRDGGEIRLKASWTAGDFAYADCLATFGFEPGQILKPFGGLNEFLSALTMAKCLERHLPRKALAAIAVCIESSIPFRGEDAAGRGVGEALESRLASLSRDRGLGASDEEIRSMVHRAIAFANVDVKDFAQPDPGLFLSNTWKLLPESNASLRRRGAFGIREYRVALQKMQGFFRSLAPGSIYHSYRGLPGAEEMARLEGASRRNLEYAQAYMQAKLLAVGIIEAIAEISGGDAPIMGDLPQAGSVGESLTDFLPDLPAPPWIYTDNPVYRLLKDGRLDESSFDLKNSPLAIFLYHRLSPNVWGERARSSEEFFAGKLTAEAFLMGFDPKFRAEFGGACMRMVPTRREALESWLAARP